MKRSLNYIICAAFVLSIFSGVAKAESNYEVKNVGVVDLKRIMDESLAAKTAQKEINSIKEKYFAEIKKHDKELQGRQKELMDQKKAISADAFNKKVAEFRDRIDQERNDAAKKQKVIEAAFAKSLELIKDETVKVVTEIAQERKLDLVVPTSQLLFGRKGLDISDEVLKRLNQRLTKVNINIKPGKKAQ